MNEGKEAKDIKFVYDYATVKKATGDWLKDAPKRLQNQLAAEKAKRKKQNNSS